MFHLHKNQFILQIVHCFLNRSNIGFEMVGWRNMYVTTFITKIIGENNFPHNDLLVFTKDIFNWIKCAYKRDI